MNHIFSLSIIRIKSILIVVMSIVFAALALTQVQAAELDNLSPNINMSFLITDNIYQVKDLFIESSARGLNTDNAKKKAIVKASLQAFKIVIRAIVPRQHLENIIETKYINMKYLIQSVSVDDERFGRGLYEARFDISLDLPKLQQLLKAQKIPFAQATKVWRVLILPLYSEAAGTVLWNVRNKWLSAWRKGEGRSSLVHFVLPRGDVREVAHIVPDMLLNSDNTPLFKQLKQDYKVDAILLSHADVQANFNNDTSVKNTPGDENTVVKDGHIILKVTSSLWSDDEYYVLGSRDVPIVSLHDLDNILLEEKFVQTSYLQEEWKNITLSLKEGQEEKILWLLFKSEQLQNVYNVEEMLANIPLTKDVKIAYIKRGEVIYSLLISSEVERLEFFLRQRGYEIVRDEYNNTWQLVRKE